MKINGNEYEEYVDNFLILIVFHIEIPFFSYMFNTTVSFLSVYFVQSNWKYKCYTQKKIAPTDLPNIFHRCWKQILKM